MSHLAKKKEESILCAAGKVLAPLCSCKVTSPGFARKKIDLHCENYFLTFQALMSCRAKAYSLCIQAI